MQRDALSFKRVAAFPHHGGNAFVKWIRERDVADDPVLEEREGSDPLSAVDDRVWHHEVAGLYFFTQRADGREGDDGPHADGAEGGDIGAGGYLVRSELVVEAVAGEEGDGDGLAGAGGGVFEDGDGGCRSAPGCGGVERGDLVEVRQV